MKNLPLSNFKKKTNTLYRYRAGAVAGDGTPTVGDPTNTTITILTTVSHIAPADRANPGRLPR